MGSFFAVFTGLALFGLIHSVLLTEPVRLAGEAFFGPRRFNRWFRLGYSLFALGWFGGYLHWAVGLPDTPWFGVQGPLAWLLRAGWLLGAWVIWRATARFGLLSFLGAGASPGGPAEDHPLVLGPLATDGPYALVRHPMYAGGMLLLWCSPDWSANRFAFALAGTLYLVAGSLHEERRLTRAYGQAYRSYCKRLPRFFPKFFE